MPEETFSRLFINACKKWDGKYPAMRQKKYGVWSPYSWDHLLKQARYFGLGLISLGFKAGDRLTIVGNNKPEWYYAQFASICCRGLPTAASPDSEAEDILNIILQSGSSFVIVENQEQVDKMLSIAEKLPEIKRIIYWDAKGMRDYNQPSLMYFNDVVQLGREYDNAHSDIWDQMIEQRKPEDPVLIIYTADSEGMLKGIVHSSSSVIAASGQWDSCSPTQPKDNYISALNLANGSEFLYIVPSWLKGGACLNFPEQVDTLGANIRELGPSKMVITPAIAESYVSLVRGKIDDTSSLKRLSYNFSLPIGSKVARMKLENKDINVFWKAAFWIAHAFTFRPIKDWLGLLKCRVMTINGAVASEVFEYLSIIGIDARVIYGSAECTPATMHTSGNINLETSGQPTHGSEVRILETGEILTRGPQLMLHYYNSIESTDKIIDRQGWFHTGDAGFLNGDGHMTYADRLANVVKLKDGTKFSPSYINNKLKFSAYINQTVVVGEGQDFIGALVAIDPDNVGTWATKRKITYFNYSELAQKDEVYNLIKSEIAKANRGLPPKFRVKRFLLLQRAFDSDDTGASGIVRLTQKDINQRYMDIISAIYSGKSEYISSLRIKNKVGREETVTTSMKIVDLEGTAK